jgi:HTH-type transcriptional regulator/antitoxin HigA
MITCVTANSNTQLKIIKNMVMETLKYKIIKSATQYNQYCKALEKLLDTKHKTGAINDEIELLTFLIEKWDAEHNTFDEVDPVRLLHSLMEDHQMRAKDLVELLGISKGYVSDILRYRKGLSKEVIRKLAERFKVRQEAFNRPYPLKVAEIGQVHTPNVLIKRKKTA